MAPGMPPMRQKRLGARVDLISRGRQPSSRSYSCAENALGKQFRCASQSRTSGPCAVLLKARTDACPLNPAKPDMGRSILKCEIRHRGGRVWSAGCSGIGGGLPLPLAGEGVGRGSLRNGTIPGRKEPSPATRSWMSGNEPARNTRSQCQPNGAS